MVKPFENTKEWYDDEYHAYLKDSKFVLDRSFIDTPARSYYFLEHLDVRPEHKILVVGCSVGSDILQLDQDFGCRNIVAADISSTAIKFVKKQFPHIEGWVCCASKLPSTYKFDRIVAMDVTEHMEVGIYMRFLYRAYGIMKIGSKLGILPGLTGLPQHTNVLLPRTIAEHMIKVGFETELGYYVPEGKERWIIGIRN